MLSYQHDYHAGNHADVLKHWLLLECLAHMQQKDKGLVYIDTHAGAGLYRLDSPMARKTGEADAGIRRLLAQPPEGMETYISQVRPEVTKHRYPGSAALVSSQLRPQDQGWLFELHPQAVRELERYCGRTGHAHVRQSDGFAGLLALLPVASRRALVLIDPAYEIKDDYRQVVTVLEQAWRKLPQLTALLWYPMIDRARIDRLERDVRRSKLKNAHLFELGVREPAAEAGMTASGVIVLNPPWTLIERVNALLPRLSAVLADDGQSRWRSLMLQKE